MRGTTFILVFLVAGLSFARSTPQPSGWQVENMRTYSTFNGELRIDQYGRDGFRIFVGPHYVHEFEGFDVAVWGILPSEDTAHYILLGVDTGNSYCPYRYYLLDVLPYNEPLLTRQFATCSPIPKMTMQGQSVEMEFPPSPYMDAQKWIYDPLSQRLERYSL